MKRTLLASSIMLVVSGCAITPEAVSPARVSMTATADLEQLTQDEAQITQAISLEEAIARAVKFNRDKRLKSFEAALAQGQLELVQQDMLPELTTSAGYSRRNNYAASASTTFQNGKPAKLNNPTYSVSQGKEQATKDAVFTWDILDFGLSYVRAKQHADRYLIAQERERKSLQNIVQDVRAAYWRAVSAERLLAKIDPLMEQAATALDDSRQIELRRLSSPMEALYYQRELLDVLRALQSLKQDLLSAKVELASLMDIKPGTLFSLADTENPEFSMPELNIELAVIEEQALRNRPELLETYYQQRISVQETRAAFLKMLPGLSLTAGAYDSNNKYLLNQDWTSIGARVSWNLFDVFKVPVERRMAKTRAALAQEQRLAASMAVLAQVHLANTRFEQTRNSFNLADRYLQVASRINEQIRNAAELEQTAELDLIRESLNLLLAELRRDVAYADLQNSYGRIFASMGMDLLPKEFADTSIEELTLSIESRFEQWQRGEMEILTIEAEMQEIEAPEMMPVEEDDYDGNDMYAMDEEAEDSDMLSEEEDEYDENDLDSEEDDSEENEDDNMMLPQGE
ncbi:TolC family protein [Endozoicomonadaceae bacterium StTr2]